MNQRSVSTVVQQHLLKIHVGVKMEVASIFVINVEFIPHGRIKFHRTRHSIQQALIPMIEIFERVYVLLSRTLHIKNEGHLLSGNHSSHR